MRLSFFSNFAFAPPAFFCFYHGMYGLGAAMLVTMVASMYYHLDERCPMHLAVDVTGVVTLCTLLWTVAMESKHVLTPMNGIAVAFAGLAFFFFFSAPCPMEHDYTDEVAWAEYDSQHALWHLFVAFSVFALVYSYCFSTVKPHDGFMYRRVQLQHPRVLFQIVREGTNRARRRVLLVFDAVRTKFGDKLSLSKPP